MRVWGMGVVGMVCDVRHRVCWVSWSIRSIVVHNPRSLSQRSDRDCVVTLDRQDGK